MTGVIAAYPDLGSRISEKIIGAAIEVHKTLGPGLLESVYEDCLAIEMQHSGLLFERQKTIPVTYKGKPLEVGFRADFVVEGHLIVELKAVERLLPIHEAQLLTYLKVSGCALGLIVNFNTPLLKEGIRRLALSPSG